MFVLYTLLEVAAFEENTSYILSVSAIRFSLLREAVFHVKCLPLIPPSLRQPEPWTQLEKIHFPPSHLLRVVLR